MNPKILCALGATLGMAASALAQQAPPYQPPNYQAPPPQAPAYQPPAQYQAPPPSYQQAPPSYQQAPPPYQQAPPPYQQAPPPPYQQAPPPYQQAPPYQGYPPPPPPPAGTHNAPPASAHSHAQSQQGIQYHPWRVQIEGGYTITQGSSVKTLLNDGGSGGLGITWFPTAVFPLGFRVDGSYTSHPQTLNALALAAESTGENIADGYTDIYGGDIDAEIDLHLGLKAREYFFGGLGWYRERTTLKTVTYQQGNICSFFCYPGYYPVYSTAHTSTTDWLNSWNAGIGFEWSLGDPATFFIDGRFLRIKQPDGSYWDFIPIRVGIRF